MTPAEQLKQIEEDEWQLRQTVKGFWTVDIGDATQREEGKALDLESLARLVEWAKKGASVE